MSIVEISNSEYLELLLDTAPEHQDLYWCIRTKMQLRKVQSLSGYNLQEQLEEVDSKFKEIQNRNENI
jgi:hypothetical protein